MLAVRTLVPKPKISTQDWRDFFMLGCDFCNAYKQKKQPVPETPHTVSELDDEDAKHVLSFDMFGPVRWVSLGDGFIYIALAVSNSHGTRWVRGAKNTVRC